MRIKINDKIYRLKEIESGVDSLMELVEEPKYKDGDFVVNEFDSILILKETRDGFVFDHAYLPASGELFIDKVAGYGGIKRHATTEEKQRMIEALAERGKRWNAEKKCIEDIPKRKFNVGDKVVLKSGYKKSDGLIYLDVFDLFIGRKITVAGYTDVGNVCFYDCPYIFEEEWIEPYVEELKEGDLAIFWYFDKTQAVVRLFDNKQGDVSQAPIYVDNTGHWWANAIKFESKEQYEKLLKGEI